ncbi:MAG TPA: alternative ribosome rescue aminoacyl-tRNA hydrolase ArfB [Acidocella sp.]|nr:alternative ribosome rescue aminoacyl-tRNA hydrolase ArfB [Acidocella sp.]OYV52329.1 MAG: aminoacyl-tRNA hydrolase [Acidocella sp. 20-58-15]OYY04271.1 MAG: aminoacyl-tRNA hydrolase [Acidocella sp. 35-58-6]HQT39136.1 alternative ribosome rescue aminoacyl-tRNA hydrolase ArfB [Acidocella sp.]
MIIQITPRLSIDESELEESFITASGPGGQNVNKVATAVQLRFNLTACATLPPAVKARLATIAGRRLTNDGVIVITANQHRTQLRNRADARERLFEMIREAAIAPIYRKPTRPTLASKTRRLDAKSSRAGIKKLRNNRDLDG